MTKYENLLDNIENSDILYFPSDSARMPAQSIKIQSDCGIFFNEAAFSTSGERFVALSHEKSHCDAEAFYSVHAPLLTREYEENRAWRWTIREVLPFDDLMDAFDACRTVDGVELYDLAEYLDFPEDFVKRAIELYVKMGKQIV